MKSFVSLKSGASNAHDVEICTTFALYLNIETIALCGTRCVIFDIQAWSFTGVNSLRPQSQCLAITAFCKASQKNKFYLSFWRPSGGLILGDVKSDN